MARSLADISDNLSVLVVLVGGIVGMLIVRGGGK
jgi:hypothetical protein